MILGLVTPTTTGHRSTCHHNQQEGSSQAKRPRHPTPSTSPIIQQFSTSTDSSFSFTSSSLSKSSSLSEANKENQPKLSDEVTSTVGQISETAQRDMGANLGRHSGKGLKDRRAQSSSDLYDTKGISVSKILAPCSKSSRER